MDGEELEGGSPEVMAVTGRLDSCAASEFETDCAASLKGGERRLILDFEGLEYISSAGLRAVLALAKRLKAQGGYLALCGLHGGVKDVFTVSGFTTLIPIFAKEADALAWAKEQENP